MGIFDSHLEYLGITDAIAYLSKYLGSPVLIEDVCSLISNQKIKIWARIRSNVLIRSDSMDLPLGNFSTLPHHPKSYFMTDRKEIDDLEVLTLRAGGVLEFGMTSTDLIAIESKLLGNSLKEHKLTYPITLIQPDQREIYYLFERISYGWGIESEWYYEPLTEIPETWELVIYRSELDRLVNEFKSEQIPTFDDLLFELPQEQSSSPTDSNAQAFQSLSAPPPKQIPSEVTANKVSAALIRLLSESSSVRYAHLEEHTKRSKLSTIASDLIKSERKHRGLEKSDPNPKGFSDSTLHNIKKADEHYHDISLESALLDYLTRISDPNK